MKKIVTYEDLEAQNADLSGQLSACWDRHRAEEGRVRTAFRLLNQAREFEAAYMAHPWPNQYVYEAGRALILTVQRLPEADYEN